MQDMTPLQEVERLRAEFLGMVNDELLTPLTTIKGSTATVLGSPCPLDPAETQQFFRIINEQTDQIRDLINNLLDATRIEAGTFSIHSESTDLAGIVVEARNAFLSGEAKNDVITDLPPDLPRVMADRQRIMKAMNTLFSNASKNSPEESHYQGDCLSGRRTCRGDRHGRGSRRIHRTPTSLVQEVLLGRW